MTFDPTSLPQRLYLAEAIRCYIKDKNIPLAFNKKPDGEPIDCLLTRLKTFKTNDRPGGIHIDRDTHPRNCLAHGRQTLPAPRNRSGCLLGR